jgi:hypothetical protein
MVPDSELSRLEAITEASDGGENSCVSSGSSDESDDAGVSLFGKKRTKTVKASM